MDYEHQKLAVCPLLTSHLSTKTETNSLADVEFKVFSQWGDDGIILWRANHLDIPCKTFIEFGVEDFRESKTRFFDDEQ